MTHIFKFLTALCDSKFELSIYRSTKANQSHFVAISCQLFCSKITKLDKQFFFAGFPVNSSILTAESRTVSRFSNFIHFAQM